jgi:hypothetical protein
MNSQNLRSYYDLMCHTAKDVRLTVKALGELNQAYRLMFACYLVKVREANRPLGGKASSYPVEEIETALTDVDSWLGRDVSKRKKMRLHEISEVELLDGERVCMPGATGRLDWVLSDKCMQTARDVVEENKSL